MGRVTLQTIADHVGVSRMTVSNAFSRPDQLSADLRARILEAADLLGYCGPDPIAKGLSQGRTGTIGVLFTGSLSYAFRDRVATEFLGGVASVVEAKSTGLAVLAAPRTGPEGGAVARAVLDGLILYSVDHASAGLAVARRRELPTVQVDQKPEPGYASVNVDDRAGATAAARHVVSLGHRNVALLTKGMSTEPALVDPHQPVTHHVIEERLGGWLAGLEEAGITPTAASSLGNERSAARSAAELLLANDPAPTAVLCMSDVMARGVIDAAEARGLRVPDDLSVVGFDDSPDYALDHPALTTVRQPVHDKGRIAAELLLNLLGDLETAESAHTLLPVQLVVRNSTGPAPGGSSTRPEKRRKDAR